MDDDVGLLIPDNNPSPEPPRSSETQDDNILYIRETEKNFQQIGITVIVLGGLSVAFGIGLTCAYHPGLDESGSGIWTGIPAMVCGALSITLKYQRSFTMVLTAMIISLVGTMFGLIGICFTGSTFFSICFTCPDSIRIMIPSGILMSIEIAWVTMVIYIAVITARMIHVRSSINCCKDISSNQFTMPMAYVPGYGIQPITGQQLSQLMPENGQNAVPATVTMPPNLHRATS